MTPEQAIVTRIQAIGAVAAIVGTRVYQLRLPQSVTTPAVRVQQVSELDVLHLRGAKALSRTRVQVDVYADLAPAEWYGTAANLADAINGDGSGNGLAGWLGTVGTLRIAGVFRVDRQTMDEAEIRMVRIRQDYIVWWRPV